MKYKWILMYLDIAYRFAQESHAQRLKVGSLFISTDGVMSSGINGLPEGGLNVCEGVRNGELYTLPQVSHAEENLFGKLMRQGVSTKGGIIVQTHMPCLPCAKIIRNAGIHALYYSEDYRDTSGVDFLMSNGINVIKVKR